MYGERFKLFYIQTSIAGFKVMDFGEIQIPNTWFAKSLIHSKTALKIASKIERI
jgi:hypothetical protein